MSKFIGITIGDINGIGIHILIKSWKQKKIKNFILFCNKNEIEKFINKNKYKIKLNVVNLKNNKINYEENKINIYSYKTLSSEENTYKSLKYAYKYCANNFCKGLITLPIRKDLIKTKINKKFIGQTEYFQNLDKKKYSNMILYHKKIIVSPITTHIKISILSKTISNNVFLYNQISNLNNTLKLDFNINKPKLIISGLNPHAGENGQIGSEEKKYITPIIKKLKKSGVLIDGPMSADSILINKNLLKYDCFIFIFHDQALIPFKFISKFTGVNYTGNLNIIRTSPDHGTAYDLIKTKKFSNKSFINCFKLINKIYKNRMINGKI